MLQTASVTNIDYRDTTLSKISFLQSDKNKYSNELVYPVMAGSKASIRFIIESTIGQDSEPIPSNSHPHKSHFLSPSLENK